MFAGVGFFSLFQKGNGKEEANVRNVHKRKMSITIRCQHEEAEASNIKSPGSASDCWTESGQGLKGNTEKGGREEKGQREGRKEGGTERDTHTSVGPAVE